MNSDEHQVQVGISGISSIQFNFSVQSYFSDVTFIRASTMHASFSLCFTDAGKPVSVISSAFCCPCLLQVFISSHLHLTTPFLDLWGPLFPIKLLTPTYQFYASAVITCVYPYLRSPHPVSKSRIRVQSVWETRSPPLLFPLSLSARLSPWLQGCVVVAMGK